MKVTIACTVGLLLALGATVARSQQPSQKPVKERTIHSAGGQGAPSTLAKLYEISPLVIDATVQASRPVDRVLKAKPPGEDTVIVQTAHTLVINEVFKDVVSGGIQGKRVELVQLGGERDRGDYIESVVDEGFPPLRRGERYLFFLKPSPSGDGTYLVSTDTPDGVLLLDPYATVKARGSSRLARQLEQSSQADLINALRNLRDGGR